MKKILALLFLITAILTLASCGTAVEPEKKDESTAPDIEVPLFEFFGEDGNAAFVFVTADSLSAENRKKVSELAGNFGNGVRVLDEFDYGDYKPAHAVIFGALGNKMITEAQKAVTEEMKNGLLCYDYALKAERGNIYAVGGSDKAISSAIDFFFESFSGKTSAAGDYLYEHREEYKLKKLSVKGVPIGEYSIIYDKTRVYSAQLATDIRDKIAGLSGRLLGVYPDTRAESGYEILVGVTEREASQKKAASYPAPNNYFDIAVEGTKILAVNEGYRTGTELFKAFSDMLDGLSGASCDLDETVFSYSGNIGKIVDTSRADGTELRVMQANILFGNGEASGFPTTDRQRGELQADTILAYYPDIVTFNELGESYDTAKIIINLLSPYYDFPEGQSAYAVRTAIKKGSGIKAVSEGREYFKPSDKFHTAAWTVAETPDGKRFAVINAHLIENKDTDGNWIADYSNVVLDAAQKITASYPGIPVIMNGDWFFWKDTLPYVNVTRGGFLNASETADRRSSTVTGTFYHPDKDLITVEEDICFYRGAHALSHRIVYDFVTRMSSDHMPLVTDFKFDR